MIDHIQLLLRKISPSSWQNAGVVYFFRGNLQDNNSQHEHVAACPAVFHNAFKAVRTLFYISQQPRRVRNGTKRFTKTRNGVLGLFTCWFLERKPVGLRCPQKPCERLKSSSVPAALVVSSSCGHQRTGFLPSLQVHCHVNPRDARGCSLGVNFRI